MATLLFVAFQLKFLLCFEVVDEEVLKEIFAVFCPLKCLSIGRMVVERSEFWQILPVDSENDEIAVVPELLVLKKRDVLVEAALFAFAGPGSPGPATEHELLLAKHTVVFIVVVSFYHSDLVLCIGSIDIGSSGCFEARAALLIAGSHSQVGCLQLQLDFSLSNADA